MKKIIIFLVVTCNLYAQEVKFRKVTKEELVATKYDLDSTASAAYLYKSRKTFYEYNKEDGFLVTTKVHERIKIYSKEGLEYANKLISYYKPESGDGEKVTGIKAYTFNIENGNIIEEKLSSKQIFDEKKSKFWSYKKIAMPAVKIGSVIDLKYELRSPYHTNIDDVAFQFAIPVKKYYTKISIPEYYNFRKKSKGFYHVKSQESSSNKSIDFSTRNRNTSSVSYSKVNYKCIIDVFEDNNIPALKDNEPYVSNIKNYRGGLSYELSYVKYPNSIPESYTTTWEAVSEKIHQFSGFGGELEKTSYFKKDLSAVIAGASSDIEKLIMIFQYVKSKVKWNNYYGKYVDQGVRKAYKEGVGNVADINLMLTAMLREAGLEANPVLVSSKDNGVPLFPTMKGFNYVISIVNFNDGSYALLDATEKYSIPNVLPIRANNWNGRKITKNGTSSWVTLTPSKHALEDNKIYAKITSENTIEGIQRTTFKNLNAINYRIKNNSLKEEDVITNLEEEYTIEIDDFKVLNKKELTKPVGRNLKFVTDVLIEEVNDKLYIDPLLYLSLKENPFKAEERKFPVDFITPWKDKNIISLTLPEGYKVMFLPESLTIGLPNDLGVFSFSILHTNNKITVQSIIQLNQSKISPQYYPQLREFYNQLVKKQSEKIILIKE